MEKIAVFGVVFPSVEKYLDPFFTSWQAQTFPRFDLWIVNDGISNLGYYQKKYKELNICELNFHGTPAKLRELGINYLLEKKYDAIIFSDADDYFATNRIEKSLELLQSNDMVANDFDLIDRDGREIGTHYLSHRLSNRAIITLEDIANKNYCGLSNTAISGKLSKKIEFDERLIAVDWFFFSLLLNQGYRAIFTNETWTYYRQHSCNTAGIGTKLDEQKILKGLDVKLLHYAQMAKINANFQGRYDKYSMLKQKLSANEAWKDRYCKKVLNSCIPHPLWWEEIRLEEEL